MKLKPEIIIELRSAVAAKESAQKRIAEIAAMLPGRNKTHSIRRALGLCPECGAEKPQAAFYCDDCRDIMTTNQIRLNKRKANK